MKTRVQLVLLQFFSSGFSSTPFISCHDKTLIRGPFIIKDWIFHRFNSSTEPHKLLETALCKSINHANNSHTQPLILLIGHEIFIEAFYITRKQTAWSWTSHKFRSSLIHIRNSFTSSFLSYRCFVLFLVSVFSPGSTDNLARRRDMLGPSICFLY